MAEYSSDEERFSAVINFFKDYKAIISLSLLAIFVPLFSIIGYQSYKETRSSEAAIIYDKWLVELQSNNESSKETFNKLQDAFSGTGYAQLAIMINGSNLARQGNLKDALVNFQQLSDDTSGYFGNKVLNSIAKINIARIELSNKNFTNVLEVLDSFVSNSEHSMVYEIKGDALFGLNKIELAKEQYQLAIDNARDESQKSILKIKINSIQL